MPEYFDPMKGDAIKDLSKVRFPKRVSYKLDGIRCVMLDGVAHSFNMRPINNRFIQEQLAGLETLDGELIVGAAHGEGVYGRSNSGVMSYDGEPDFRYFVFDSVHTGYGFEERFKLATQIVHEAGNKRVLMVPHKLIHTLDELLAFEGNALLAGYEGIMLRDPVGPYKFGRSTEREGWLNKLKRELKKDGSTEEYYDGEARIVGTFELMHNANELTKDAKGRAKRSSAKAGKVPTGTLGGYHAVGIGGPFDGVDFDVGTGFTKEQRVLLWQPQHQMSAMGTIFKYKSQMAGVKDKPRFPVWLGPRDPSDMAAASEQVSK